MLVSGELNHFSFYFGKNQNIIYCTLAVKETTGTDLVYRPDQKNNEKHIGLRLYHTPESINLLLNRLCYFEVDSHTQKGNYLVKEILSEETFTEYLTSYPKKRRKLAGFKFNTYYLIITLM